MRAPAKRQKTTMARILDEAIEQYRRHRFLRELNADFDALKRNSREWQYERQERSEWDRTVADGTAEGSK